MRRATHCRDPLPRPLPRLVADTRCTHIASGGPQCPFLLSAAQLREYASNDDASVTSLGPPMRRSITSRLSTKACTAWLSSCRGRETYLTASSACAGVTAERRREEAQGTARL